jgi:predicted transcriptional regulator of viral defense system
MSEVKPISSDSPNQMASLLAADIARRQWGIIAWRQLRRCGVSRATAHEWRAAGKLHVIHRGVYAVGHSWVPIEGRMAAAILHAGAGTVVSHATAAWWWGLIPQSSTLIHVSTESRARSFPGVRVHHPRHVDATKHRRIPITTVARTLSDLASQSPVDVVRQALAEADYWRLLKLDDLTQFLGPGRRGSKCLRQALEHHQPKLALTRSDTERRFFGLCERAGIPLPEVNRKVSRMRIDAVWPAYRVAVELDGYEGHHTPAQMERDRRRELHARMNGYLVIRYTWSQVANEPDLILADLQHQFNSPARSAGSGSR